jgi:hypothetical protein
MERLRARFRVLLGMGMGLGVLWACSTDTASSPATFSVVSADISAEEQTFHAACTEGTRVSGGCQCGTNGELGRSLSDQENSWSCGCDGIGAPAKIYGVCASSAQTMTEVVATVTAEHVVITATCPEGKQLLGGGVSCEDDGSDTVSANYPDPTTANSWSGVCRNTLDGDEKVYAYCAASTDTAVSGRTFAVTESSANSTTATAQCPSGKSMVTGGCQCPVNVKVRNSYTSDLVTWTCECESGQPAIASVLCY